MYLTYYNNLKNPLNSVEVGCSIFSGHIAADRYTR